MITKIVSGGQTGADRAAFDFAIEHEIEYGGWVPKGRLAEDGPISDEYSNLRETKTSNYPERTRQNIIDSDGTLIVSNGNLTGGSLLTRQTANALQKPCLHIDLESLPTRSAAKKVDTWITDNVITVLNVAGPRASGDPQIYDSTRDLLTLLFD